MWHACTNGHAEVVSELLSHGGSANDADEDVSFTLSAPCLNPLPRFSASISRLNPLPPVSASSPCLKSLPHPPASSLCLTPLPQISASIPCLRALPQVPASPYLNPSSQLPSATTQGRLAFVLCPSIQSYSYCWSGLTGINFLELVDPRNNSIIGATFTCSK